MSRIEKLNRLQNVECIDTNDLNFLVYNYFHPELRSSIQQFAKGKVLDIGCGNKPYEHWFEGLIDSYLGCDVVQSSANKVDILCPANQIPLPDETFQTILSTQAIEHIEDYQNLIKEAYRLLKPKGSFILSGPLYWHLHEEPYDFYRFTKHGFKYILENAGFEIIALKPNGGAWATLGLIINHTFSFNNTNASRWVKILKGIYKKCKIHILINVLFKFLDNKDYNTINTINYVVVAIKK